MTIVCRNRMKSARFSNKSKTFPFTIIIKLGTHALSPRGWQRDFGDWTMKINLFFGY